MSERVVREFNIGWFFLAMLLAILCALLVPVDAAFHVLNVNHFCIWTGKDYAAKESAQ